MSEVWKFFDNKTDSSAVCKVCQVVVKRNANTTNLITHLRKHEKDYKDYVKLKEGNKTKSSKSSGASASATASTDDVVVTTTTKRNQNQTKLTDYTTPPLNAARQCTITDAMVDWLTKDGVPLFTVEKEGFKKFMAVLEKRYNIPSRRTVSRKVSMLYDVKHDLVKHQLQEDINNVGGYYSMTTDLWSSTTTDPYMAVTIHYVTKTWELASYLLECSYLPGSHTADLLTEAINNTLSHWDLLSTSLASITTDNGANVVKACNNFPCVRFPCFGHCLNLAVKRGLDDERVTRAVAAVRKVCGHFSHSSQKQEQMTKVQEELQMPKKKLKSDCETR